jgi:hypothetical protein
VEVAPQRGTAAAAQMVAVVEQGRVVGAQWRGEGRRGVLGAIYRELEAVRGKYLPGDPAAAWQGGPRRPALNGAATSLGEVTSRRGGVMASAALSPFAA